MKSRDVQSITGLTRKALEYYEAQGLLEPSRDENGYRNYSDEDVSRLARIRAYRQLGLSLAEIMDVLSGGKSEKISDIIRDRVIRHNLDEQRLHLLSEIASGTTLDDLEEDLRALESRESIYKRISDKFPGYIGQMLFVNFAHFLKGRIETPEQMKAYEELISFLDQMEDLPFTDEELGMLQEASESITMENMESIIESKVEAVKDTEKWLEENREMVEQYQELKHSEAYRALPVVQLFEKLKRFLQESDYYERVIPLLRRMSPDYDEYYRCLIDADAYLTENLAQ